MDRGLAAGRAGDAGARATGCAEGEESEAHKAPVPRSVVLPYRGAAGEPRLLRAFLRAAMRSDVGEVVVGVDRGASEYPEIEEARRLYGGRVRAARVPPTPEWGSRFAAVVWHLIADAVNDLVLVCNVDELPTDAALAPPQKAGREPGYVLETGPTSRGGPNALPVWTGTFWVWRPALEDYFDASLYRGIRDGGDRFFFWSAVKAGLRYHRRRGPWIEVAGGEHMGVGWYRWSRGFRNGARAQEAWAGIGLWRRAARNAWEMRRLAGRRSGAMYVAGWLAAAARPGSYWAGMARTLSIEDWVHQGRLPYDDVWRRWWRRRPSGRAVVACGTVAGSPSDM